VFLAEYVVPDDEMMGASKVVLRNASNETIATYDDNDLFGLTNGYRYIRKSRSYNKPADLERDVPPDTQFSWIIERGAKTIALSPICIGGPERATAIPSPAPLKLSQGGRPVAPDAIDPGEDLAVEFPAMGAGVAWPGSDWRDLNLLLLDDQFGRVLYTGGAPGAESGFLDGEATGAIIPAGTLHGGGEFVLFISQVRFVDSNESHGVRQVAANSYAIELPILTIGEAPAAEPGLIPRRSDHRFSRKVQATDRLQPWPSFAERIA